MFVESAGPELLEKICSEMVLKCMRASDVFVLDKYF